jgi:hypothetical protein
MPTAAALHLWTRLRSGTLKLLHSCAERRRRQGADDPIDGAAVSKKDQRRNAEDAKPRGEARLIINVHLDYRQRVLELAGDCVDMWSEHAAWWTPRRSEVHEREIRRVFHERDKALGVDVRNDVGEAPAAGACLSLDMRLSQDG